MYLFHCVDSSSSFRPSTLFPSICWWSFNGSIKLSLSTRLKIRLAAILACFSISGTLKCNGQTIKREEESKHGYVEISKGIVFWLGMEQPPSKPEHQGQTPILKELTHSKPSPHKVVVDDGPRILHIQGLGKLSKFRFLQSQCCNRTNAQLSITMAPCDRSSSYKPVSFPSSASVTHIFISISALR